MYLIKILTVTILSMIYQRHILRYKSFRFSIQIIRFVSELPKIQIYWIITDQLLRSATSIGANIFEAKSASSKNDFIKYYEIALKSTNETIYWLKLLKEIIAKDRNKKEELLETAIELGKLLGSSIKTLKKSKSNYKF